MLLGKRPRPPIMRRTTSMSGGMAVEDMQVNTNNLESHEEQVVSADNSLHLQVHEQGDAIKDPPHHGMVADHTKDVVVAMVMSPSPNTTNNHPQNQTTNNTPHFLLTCGLCKCHLAPARDIYMYRYVCMYVIMRYIY